MEAKGFKRILKEALDNSKKVKVIFQYPATDRATIKSGNVISVDEDSFTINDIKDGESTFSYGFVVEIKFLGEVVGNDI